MTQKLVQWFEDEYNRKVLSRELRDDPESVTGLIKSRSVRIFNFQESVVDEDMILDGCRYMI